MCRLQDGFEDPIRRTSATGTAQASRRDLWQRSQGPRTRTDRGFPSNHRPFSTGRVHQARGKGPMEPSTTQRLLAGGSAPTRDESCRVPRSRGAALGPWSGTERGGHTGAGTGRRGGRVHPRRQGAGT